MRAHLRDRHGQTPGDKQDLIRMFKFKVIRRHTTALSRQIHEAVAIKRTGGTLLNSKIEYNRCTIPTLETDRRPRKREQIRETTRETETNEEPNCEKRKMEETEQRQRKRMKRTDSRQVPQPPKWSDIQRDIRDGDRIKAVDTHEDTQEMKDKSTEERATQKDMTENRSSEKTEHHTTKKRRKRTPKIQTISKTLTIKEMLQ